MITTETEPVLDDNGNPILNDDGSVRQETHTDSFDHWNFTLMQWGMNFGVGWRQYHSKFLYTDFGVYTDAYRRENRTIASEYVNVMGDQIVSDQFFDSFIQTVKTYA